ncbi:cytochrome P450 4C1-like [Planococcus citri]|uniref:cytochrome P450 4C1-like n=1 Tax=Planococcus citri TaxID=170843 RepID=UPI0031F87609
MNFIMIIVCVIIVIILLAFIDKIKNKRFYDLLKQFPSHPTLPLIGNLHMLRGSKDDLLTRAINIMLPEDRLVFWVGPIPCLVLRKCEDIMAIFNQSQHRETLNLLNEWLGTGILNADYGEWKKSRKILSPAFSSEMLTKYTDVFNKKASSLVDNLKPASVKGDIVDAWDYVIHINIDAILANTLGQCIQNTGKSEKNYCEAILEVFENITQRVLLPWLHPHLFYLVYLKITGRIKMLDHFKYLPTKVIKQKLNMLRNNNTVLSSDEGTDDLSTTMVDLLIEKGSKETSFTETRMRDEILQLIATGTETTALNVCFTLLMLAMHQDIQQKVYEEITEVMSENDTLAAEDSMNQLKYLEQCIKETSRMYSQAVLAFRRTHKDCLLTDEKIVPKDTFVVAALHLTHYDTDLYENPSKWDPEHFSDQAIAKRPKGSELIFGYGPRLCIGARYSIISSKTQIAHILRNYHLATNIKEFTKDHLKTDLCIRSKIGYPIKFTSRRKT